MPHSGFNVNGAAQSNAINARASGISAVGENPAVEIRRKIRSGTHRSGTAGIANGYLQANLVVLPLDHAREFARFCISNPKPCPVVGVTAVGDPSLPGLGDDLNIATDIPKYRIYKDGVIDGEAGSLEPFWKEDLVGFALGCSYTFEQALLQNNIPVRHIEEQRVVPMFRTTLETEPAGRFAGGMVVSMRPMTQADAERAKLLTTNFPHAHGAPVHIGSPTDIGIADLAYPDWGDAVTVREGEVPVFWACGVTPQAVIEAAKPTVCFTHKPGHMLITDLRSGDDAMRAWNAAQANLQKLGSL